jgi:hypothetical protein
MIGSKRRRALHAPVMILSARSLVSGSRSTMRGTASAAAVLHQGAIK